MIHIIKAMEYLKRTTHTGQILIGNLNFNNINSFHEALSFVETSMKIFDNSECSEENL